MRPERDGRIPHRDPAPEPTAAHRLRVERRLLEAARQNHGQLLERLRRLEEEVQSLTAQLAQLEREDFNA